MKFTKEFLQESLGDENTVEDVIIDQSRWSTSHRRVFKHEGKFYQTFYSHGSTESQDESPYEYADDMIECEEVIPVEKKVIVYEPLKVKKNEVETPEF